MIIFVFKMKSFTMSQQESRHTRDHNMRMCDEGCSCVVLNVHVWPQFSSPQLVITPRRELRCGIVNMAHMTFDCQCKLQSYLHCLQLLSLHNYVNAILILNCSGMFSVRFDWQKG